MQPYYDADGITIYHGDCTKVDEWLSGDVLVTDPPYGMSYRSARSNDTWSSRWKGTRIAGDDDVRARDDVVAAWGDRPALLFGTWKAPLPAGVREVLVWDKVVSTGMGSLDIPWRPSWEAVYVLGHGWDARRGHGVLRHSLPTLAPDRKWHPTPKPVPLLVDLIGKCPPGVIVDPFMGAGSTLVAAKLCGRRAIGVELVEDYVRVAVDRLAQGVLDFGGAA